MWEEPCPGHIQPPYKVGKEETTPVLGFPMHGPAPWLRLGETTAPSWKERQRLQGRRQHPCELPKFTASWNRSRQRKIKTKTCSPRGFGSSSGCGVWVQWTCWSTGQPAPSTVTSPKMSKHTFLLVRVSPARKRGLSEGRRGHPVPSSRGGVGGGLTFSVPAVFQSREVPCPLPAGPRPSLVVWAGMQQKECGGVVTKVQGKDQRHTVRPSVLSPIPPPVRTPASSGDFRAGDTVRFERGTKASPWVGGGGRNLVRLVLRLQRGLASGGRAGRLQEGPCSSPQPALHSTARAASQVQKWLVHTPRLPSSQRSPSGSMMLGQAQGLPPCPPARHCGPQPCSRLSVGCTTV